LRREFISLKQELQALKQDSEASKHESEEYRKQATESAIVAKQRITILERDNQALKGFIKELNDKVEAKLPCPKMNHSDGKVAKKVAKIQNEVRTLKTAMLKNITEVMDDKVKMFSEEIVDKVSVLDSKFIAKHAKESQTEEQIQNLTLHVQKLEIPKWDQIHDAIQHQINHNFLADGTGEIDWSLQVVTHSTGYNPNGNPLWNNAKSADVVLERTQRAGDCWPMAGSEGHIVIELHQPIKVTHVRLTHLDHTITWNFGSAPKRFGVSLSENNRDWKDGGEFIYVKNLKSNVQIFPIKEHPASSFVKFEFHENYGDEKYTCIYRVRVHGEQVLEAKES